MITLLLMLGMLAQSGSGAVTNLGPADSMNCYITNGITVEFVPCSFINPDANFAICSPDGKCLFRSPDSINTQYIATVELIPLISPYTMFDALCSYSDETDEITCAIDSEKNLWPPDTPGCLQIDTDGTAIMGPCHKDMDSNETAVKSA